MGLAHIDATGRVLDGFHYSYDAQGQLTGQSEFADPPPKTSKDTQGSASTDPSAVPTSPDLSYAYDASGQLIQAGSQTYSYDANGNRTNAGYVIGPGNQILSDGAWTYSYDAEGNRIGKTDPASGLSWVYTYDDANRMTSASEYDGSQGLMARVTYTYDVFGNRIEEDTWTAGEAAPSVVRQAYNGNMVWADLNAANRVTTRYLDGAAVDELLARESADGEVAWYLTDRLGSVVDLVDDSGAVLDHIGYDAFGNVTIETNPALGDRYKFTGREYDPVTGLYYNRARWYDPETGSWTAEDESGFDPGTPNTYKSNNNSPFQFIDYSGLFNDPIAELYNWKVEISSFDQPGQQYVPMFESSHSLDLNVDIDTLVRQANEERFASLRERMVRQGAILDAPPKERADDDNGGPGFFERLVPIWGSGRAAVHNFQTGHWGWGVFDTGMAVTEVFAIKTLITLGGKALVSAGGKFFSRAAVEEVGVQAARTVKAVAAEEVATEAGVVVEEVAEVVPNIMRSPKYGIYVRRVDDFKHPLTVEHVKAALIEKGGGIVKLNPVTGLPYDHLLETRNAMHGALDRIQLLKKYLSDPNLTTEMRSAVQSELGELSKMLDNAEQILGELAR